MKILYVSDLDGTLLGSNERTSEYTNEIINKLVANGMQFSYATARSFHTSHKVTSGLNAKIPLIIYNGAMIVDNNTGEFIHKNFFGKEVELLLDDLFSNQIFPIVYSFIDDIEKFSFIPAYNSSGMNKFICTRKGDKRIRCVNEKEQLKMGEIFYVTCIDEEEKLLPLYEQYKNKFHCVYQKDIYTGDQWLEIMPRNASKSNAVNQLREILGCDYVVTFGDGKNDIDMFQIADEAYAVENAVDELKSIATGIIKSNDENGVAEWLSSHVKE